ncbi:MAG: amidinotransferase [Frankiales bacterium]|nr:amidinotransferase [Frankiales bacterium]
MTVPAQRAPQRTATPLHVLMCPPVHFEVAYAINPWMVGQTIDPVLAMHQWEGVRDAYLALGHRVDLLTPVAGLPDQVFAANGAVVVGGRGYGAKFRHPERTGEEQPFADTLARLGVRDLRRPEHVNEGEGDFLYMTDELLLAGYGFRTSREAHAEAALALGVEVLSLELVDPRFYHLDVALMTLSDDAVAVYAPAFTAQGLADLRARVPHVVEVAEADALVLGLNGVSDGRHVVLEEQALGFQAQLTALGFVPVPVPTSELRKSGGSVKCCTQELRGLPAVVADVA